MRTAGEGRRGREKNRGSFCSGYTTSSTNGDDRMFRKQNRQQVEAKRQEKLQEAAHMINGWVEYKERMTASCAFRELLAYARNRPLGHYLLESTIRNDAPELCYLTDCKQEESISLARLMQIQGSVDDSLLYTADQNFDFTQREQEATPEKFRRSQVDSDGRKTPNNRESHVEPYRVPKMHPPMAKPRREREEVDYRTMALKKPIPFNSFQERRYLLVRTNIYEMPLAAPAFAREPSLPKDHPLLHHLFVGTQHDAPADMQDVSSELDTTMTLFKSTKLPPRRQESMKNIEGSSSNSYYEQIRDSTATYFATTVTDKNAGEFGRASTEKLIRGQSAAAERVNAETDIKRVQSTNAQQQDKKAVPKVDNYYFTGK